MSEQKNLISEIEAEMEQILKSDKKSWVKLYQLMDKVEQERLYSPEHRSYTAWVNYMAEHIKVHVSLLWSRKKAGKYYSDYQQRAAAAGLIVPDMEQVNVSPDNFNLVEKIAGTNTKVADELMGKVLQGELKRSDLQNAWQTVRADKKNVRVNGIDKKNRFLYGEQTEIGQVIEDTAATAADIILELSNNPSWVPNRSFDDHVANKYRVMPEFAVRTGTSRNARRIDALVMETYSCGDKSREVHSHGIEIKVSKHDLLSDHKMQEYVDHVDYFWVAVPDELSEAARSILGDGWGLLLMDSNKSIRVEIEAKKQPAVMGSETLAAALVKML